MNLSHRRLIYSLFFLAFFILAPLTLWYALGFRWDPLTNSLVKVGAAFVKSYPSKAKIFRNGQYTGHQTAHQLINIPVGEHDFHVLKNGYEPWSKKLKVDAGVTTFIEDIVLFKTEFEKKSLTTRPSATWMTSPNLDHYAFVNGATLSVFNTDQLEAQTTASVPLGTTIKHWSTNEQQLIVKNQDQWNQIAVSSGQMTPLTSADDIQTNNGSSHWILRNSILTLDQSDSSTRLATNTRDFILRDRLVILRQNGELVVGDDRGQERWRQSVPTDSQLIDFRDNTVILRSGQETLVVNSEGIQERIPAELTDWRGDKLLLSNDFELWSYTISSKSLQLIDRTSNRIQQAFWHPSLSYLSMVQNNQLFILELDNRGEKRHRIFLAEVRPDYNFLYNKKGEEITIISPQEHYRLIIQ